mgnify:CR=1 FL=1
MGGHRQKWKQVRLIAEGRAQGHFREEDRSSYFLGSSGEVVEVPVEEVWIDLCRKSRIWKKKVSYDCRKKVADGRLRIKGKFVTREQACGQLGVESLENFSAEEIKEMLERRMEGMGSQNEC